MAFKITSIPGQQYKAPEKIYEQKAHENHDTEEQTQESWLGYGLRNAALIPKTLAKAGVTGLGLGNVAKELANEYKAPKWIHQTLKAALPTTKQAEKGYRKLGQQAFPEKVGKYITEERPEDYWPQVAAREGTLGLLGGAGKSLAQAGRYALGQAGATAGSKVLGWAGGKAGKLLGHEKAGEIGGAILGGLTGGIAAQRAFPSQTLPKKIHEKNIGEAKRVHNEAKMALPKEKVKFAKDQMNRVKNARNDITKYDKQIQDLEAIQKQAYKESKVLEPKGEMYAHKIKDVTKSIKRDINKGLSLKDKKIVNTVTKDLAKSIKKAGNQLTPEDAKIFEQNINGQIYDKAVKASSNVKRALNKLKEPLSEFIETSGSPEHAQAYTTAKSTTAQMKKLVEGRPNFIKAKNQEISDIRREKFSPETEVFLREAAKDAKKSYDTLGKENYDNIFNSGNDLNAVAAKAIKQLTPWGKAGMIAGIAQGVIGGKAGLAAGLISRFGTGIMDQVKMARHAYSNHPELFREWGHTMGDAMAKITPRVIKEMDSIGKKVAKKNNFKITHIPKN